MNNKLTVADVDLADRTVLLRVDFNVPFKPGSMEISDLTRIESSLPTIKYLLQRNCKIIICSHLGRPGGRPDEAMSLRPIAQKLEEILQIQVKFVSDCVSNEAVQITSGMGGGEIALLENLRFHSAEEANESEFARKLASLAEVYVNDAFGVAHRAHASVAKVTEYLPSVLGLLFSKEVHSLSKIFQHPDRPFTAILGGAKISDKIKVVERVSEIADDLLIGGGMCGTFIKALGYEVGNSEIEYEYLEFASRLLDKSNGVKSRVWLAEDVVVGREFSPMSQHQNCKIDGIDDRGMILDIGPKTVSRFTGIIGNSRTVFWNGPMGVFEFPAFAIGTESIAKSVVNATENGGFSLIGGGDSACEEASYLAKLCPKVYLIVRKDHLRASKIMQDRVLSNEKIDVMWNSSIVDMIGDPKKNGLESVIIEDTGTGDRIDYKCDGVFLGIGHKPNSDIFKESLKLDSSGYILTDPDSTKTSIEGVFAAGDIQDHTYRQAVTAAGSGCMAAIEAERFLETS